MLDAFVILYYNYILPYSGLFSLGANFPEWARDSGKFMLGCLQDSIVGLTLS